jgi:N-acetyl sugar amidotransferase
MVIGIDASRNRSGGAKAHLIGLLTEGDPLKYGIKEVHVWAYRSLLDSIPDRSWLIKHNPKELEKSLTMQIWWQATHLASEATKAGCNILFSAEASTFSRFKPMVVLSQDMLSFEPGEMKYYGFSKARLRLLIILFLQNYAMRFSNGVIFLTHYASKIIQKSTGLLNKYVIIPHGIMTDFKHNKTIKTWPVNNKRPINCLYVSNIAMYKHQWIVIKAIALLRKKGYNLILNLVGDGSGNAKQLLDSEIAIYDLHKKYIKQAGFVPHKELPETYANADLFIFASSCENMPVTLMEAMATGLPIACSNRGPMPEILVDGGVYFNPEDVDSIATAIEKIILDHDLRERIAHRAKKLSEQYSWSRCADETLDFIVNTYKNTRSTRNHPYQICINCVMDTSDPKIVFDKSGVCDHCFTFYKYILPNWHTDEKGKLTLQFLVKKIKNAGKGKEFDCIIGISGGIDSSYLTYITKEQLHLRPLVFHVDAGWNSQMAVNNIERLIDKLGLDLYTEVIDWEEMRDLQLAFFKSGVPHIDTPQDHAFFATMYKFAEQNNVKYILTGANYSTEGVDYPIDWMYYQSDIIQLRDIHRRFGTRLLNKFPTTSIIYHKILLPYIKGIKLVRPLDYITYNKNEAVKLLVEKFGWQPYPEKHYESRFTKFYESYWLPQKFGFDTRRVKYSSLILTKQMSRQEALEKLKNPPFDKTMIIQDFEYVATKLGISVEELQSYLDAPNKTYKDYKSQEHLYSIGSKAMKFLGLDFGGRR